MKYQINETIYTRLINNILPYYALGNQPLFDETINLIPGSFNPLHNGHLAIYDTLLNKYNPQNIYFEISVNRWDKPTYSLEEINSIIAQFNPGCDNIILSNAPAFIDKCRALNDFNLVFHVGYDTFERTPNIDTLPCTFKVYPRGGQFLNKTGTNYYPANLITSDYLYESSTNIRNNLKKENYHVEG